MMRLHQGQQICLQARRKTARRRLANALSCATQQRDPPRNLRGRHGPRSAFTLIDAHFLCDVLRVSTMWDAHNTAEEMPVRSRCPDQPRLGSATWMERAERLTSC